MVIADQASRTERVKWLLGRYPDITPEENREIVAFLKRSPALDIVLFETDGEVKPVLGRFKQDHQQEFGTSARHWAVIAMILLLLALIIYALWDYGIPS